MKMIYKIARAELQTMFFSPIAWLILAIFTFQVGMTFAGAVEMIVNSKELGNPTNILTYKYFTSSYGVFTAVQQYLYLYIPLITMGLMSREFNSGSIKLLYSSPVKNSQIILGKYLSVVIYGLILMSVLAITAIYAFFITKDLDVPMVLSGMLGIFLLICAYGAIGLFMSSLTSYQVVAAIGTFTILSVLNYVGDMWQEIDFVNDITYWLSIRGRAGSLISGLICSEDVLYFFIIIILFITLSIIRLQSRRQKRRWYKTMGKYILVLVLTMMTGYISSRPIFRFTYDTTHTKNLTLTKNSQQIIKNLKGGLSITTYANIFDDNFISVAPALKNRDKGRFDQYVRFKPETKINYVYYYDSIPGHTFPDHMKDLSWEEKIKLMARVYKVDTTKLMKGEDVRKMYDMEGEGRRFVRVIERESGERAYLRLYNDQRRHPSEDEISAAMKSLYMKLPLVGFLSGHEERDAYLDGDRNYKDFAQTRSFRYSMINQGFSVTGLTLQEEVPEEIDIIVISDMKSALEPQEMARLNRYIARGGNLIIAGEPRRQEIMNPIVEQFGVQFMPGRLARPTVEFAPDFIIAKPTGQAAEVNYIFERLYTRNRVITMPGCTGLDFIGNKGYTITPLFETFAEGVWNEVETTDFLDGEVVLNPAVGEKEQAYPTIAALTRMVGDKEQKILIMGDADCISNGELSISRSQVDAFNFSLVTGAFYWLSDNEVPIDTRRPSPIDNKIYLGLLGGKIVRILFMYLLPIGMAVYAVLNWIRRRGR